MWYRAASFSTESICRSTWKELQNKLTRFNIDMFTVSLIYESKWCLVALNTGYGNPPLQVQEIIEAYLQRGTPIQIATGALNSLYQRHVERRQHADSRQVGPGLQYEGHAPLTMRYEDNEDPLIHRQHREEVIKTFTERGYPFLEIYSLFYKSQIEQDFYSERVLDPSALKLGELTLQQLLNSERYMFTDSARAMHKAVDRGATAWINPARDTWIEQDTPQELLSGLEKVKALYLKRMHPEDIYQTQKEPFRESLMHASKAFKNTWSIAIIDLHTYFHLTLLYDTQEGEYSISFDHACPYGKCVLINPEDNTPPWYSSALSLGMKLPRYFREIHEQASTPGNYGIPLVQPCTQCSDNADTIMKWLHTAMKQIQGGYALSSNPAPFPVKNLSYTEKKLVERGKKDSKGKPKEKSIPVYVPYTFVTYDVSVTPAPAPTPVETASEQGEAPARLNWLSLHGQEDLIYEKRVQPPIKRHYRLPYFRTLVEKVKQGEVTSPEGEQYELVEEQDSPMVIGTVHFPNGRYVPMLKPEAKKQVVYKRVIASKYASEK